ncbi:MAG: hypothetical protein OSA51_11215 [Octadecabacter sp.]|nr:hypothetical protein [Octadecabacter sp.]
MQNITTAQRASRPEAFSKTSGQSSKILRSGNLEGDENAGRKTTNATP